MAFRVTQEISLQDMAKQMNGFVIIEQTEAGTYIIGVKNEQTTTYIPSRGIGSKKEWGSLSSASNEVVADGVLEFKVISKGVVKPKKPKKPMSEEHKAKLAAGRTKKKK